MKMIKGENLNENWAVQPVVEEMHIKNGGAT